MTIRVRLALGYGLAIAATLVVASVLVWLRFATDLRSTLDEALSVQAADAAAGMSGGPTSLRDDPARPGIFTLVIDRADRIVEASSAAPRDIGHVELGATTWQPAGATTGMALYAEAAPRGLRVVVGSSLSGIDRELGALAGLMVAAGVIAVAGSVAGGWWLAGRAMSPVSRLVAEADRIHASDVAGGERLEVPNPRDELGRLAETLNRMLARIDTSISRQRAFVAAASHDLRTPIAALRTELELAEREHASPDELRKAIGRALADAQHLGDLASDLLGVASAERGGWPVGHARIDLTRLVPDIVRRWSGGTGRPEVELVVEVQSSWVESDPTRIEQALGNLVANAVRHGPTGEPVVVRACVTVLSAPIGARSADDQATTSHRAQLEAEVLDRGSGVDPAAVGFLFLPFAHHDRSGGTGLGLATASAAISALGGRIGYRDRPGGGAWFWFRIPVDLADGSHVDDSVMDVPAVA